MIEENPFEVFCPPKARILILGGFAAKDGKKGTTYDWYYSNGRNQFWRLLERVYGVELKNKIAQQALFYKIGIAIADTILKCERIGNSSLDSNLINFEYNITGIAKVLDENKIEKIFFTSRFVYF